LSDQTDRGSYGQFCPVAMAAEIVCSRWTALVLRELLMGSTRFNDLRRGVPRMSPTLLSKRLKELEEAGVIVAVPTAQAGVVDYRLTDAGEELRVVVESLGVWGQRWVESSVTLKNLDPSLLMWDMRRNLRIEPLPTRRCTINFLFPELDAARKSWWLVIDGGKVDLCGFDPGYEVDLYVRGSLYSMTSVWIGHSTLRTEVML
jgi:DNA-binding HxlR family transcriptional regulator